MRACQKDEQARLGRGGFIPGNVFRFGVICDKAFTLDYPTKSTLRCFLAIHHLLEGA